MFGRGQRPAPAAAVVAIAPVVTAGPPTGLGPGLLNGWAPGYGSPHPSQQVGRFSGPPLTQYPARIEGPQLHGGREWGTSGWFTPTRFVQPAGGTTQVGTVGTPVPVLRNGSTFTGPIGPISARSVQTNVAAAQVRQSGLSAMGWAKALTGQGQG
jgi:hypothetical protein